MYLFKSFINVATVNTELDVYKNFKNSLLQVDWNSNNVGINADVLSYSPGFTFHNVPWSNNHPGFTNKWGAKQNYNKAESIMHAREKALPFFDYLEQLIPNYKIVRAEMLYHPPEKEDKYAEYQRMHIDRRNLHVYSIRCQLAFLTNKLSFLMVEDDFLNPTVSTVITFNNRKTHWGVNWGSTPRLTLVFDALDQTLWRNLTPGQQKDFFENIAPEDPDYTAHLEYKKKFAEKWNLKLI